MKRHLLAGLLACLFSTAALPQDAAPQQGNLADLAARLQQLSAADRQALKAQLEAGQDSRTIMSLLEGAPNSPGAQGNANWGQLLLDALKDKDEHPSLQLNRPQYESGFPDVGSPVMPTLPDQPTVIIPGLGPEPRCERPAYCRHLQKPGPLYKCKEESATGGNQ